MFKLIFYKELLNNEGDAMSQGLWEVHLSNPPNIHHNCETQCKIVGDATERTVYTFVDLDRSC